MRDEKKEGVTENAPQIKTRALTTEEQQRVQALRARRGDNGRNTPCLWETFDNEGKTRIRPTIKKALSAEDSIAEYAARVYEATGCDDPEVGGNWLLRAVLPLCQRDAAAADIAESANTIGKLMAEFRPRDAIEGALCIQVVICQEKAMDLIRRAGIQTHSDWARTHHNAASKLLVRSQSALQMLITYRRGGQQKMIVERVNVEAGGQAAIGQFQSGLPGGGFKQENRRGTP